MLDRVGFLLTTPFFDPATLAEARAELTEAVDLFKQNDTKSLNSYENYYQI